MENQNKQQKVSNLVSVNLTTYNRAHLLPRALDSILNQSYQDMEIIVVDDCSEDNTAEVVKNYIKKDARIKYFCHEVNSGNAKARNTALEKCKGAYVAFMDDDDEWIDNRKIEKQVNILNSNHNVGVVCSSVRLYKERNKQTDKLIEKPKN